MKIAITGATGYIGRNLIEAVLAKAFVPIALTRTAPTLLIDWIAYDLTQPAIELPVDVDCVIHLAMNLSIASTAEQQQEVAAADRLIAEANRISAKFIYLSSQTATEFATTYYGKTKWEIERLVLAQGGVVVRPGLVYGGVPSGLFFQLSEFVKKSILLPCFLPSPMVQPIHINDLSKALLYISENFIAGKIYCIAEADPISFYKFLSLISSSRLRKIRFPVLIPRVIINIFRCVLPQNSSLIRLHSLFTLPRMDTAADLKELNLHLRSTQSGLHTSGENRRRLLLEEAKVYFDYLGLNNASIYYFRHFVRVVEQQRDSRPIGFSKVCGFFPLLLALLENNSGARQHAQYEEFIWRLDAATCISEASIAGSRRFLRQAKYNSFFFSALICSKAVAAEIFFRIAKLVINGFADSIVLSRR